MEFSTATGWQVMRMAWSTPRELVNFSPADTSLNSDCVHTYVGRDKTEPFVTPNVHVHVRTCIYMYVHMYRVVYTLYMYVCTLTD